MLGCPFLALELVKIHLVLGLPRFGIDENVALREVRAKT